MSGRERAPPIQGVELAFHAQSDAWNEVRVSVPPFGRDPGFRAEYQEVIDLLRKRGLVARLRPSYLSASEVYEVLSALPGGSGVMTVIKYRNEPAPAPSCAVVAGRRIVYARSPVVAAVVAAALSTRRPLRPLTALSTRLLLEGRAVVRPTR